MTQPVPSDPRICDLDPTTQILIELRVMNEILAQMADIQDTTENLRASVWKHLSNIPTLTSNQN